MFTKLNLSEEEIHRLNYERFQYPCAKIQKKLHALYLKAVGYTNTQTGKILSMQESELAFHLDYPIDILPIPMVAKNILKNKFKCEYLKDVLSVMLLQQRKGLTHNVRNMGKKSIVELENYFCEIGLLTIKNKCYISPLCI
jgi:hypothetical protein